MNRLEVFQLGWVLRPNFDERRNAEDEIAATKCQYGGCITIGGRIVRFTSLLQQTPRRRGLGLAELAGRPA